MDKRDLLELLDRVAQGDVLPEEALDRMQVDSVSNLGYAQVDNTRGLRQGVSEVIYGAGKSAAQISGICTAMLDAGQSRILITRLDGQKQSELIADLQIKVIYQPLNKSSHTIYCTPYFCTFRTE